MDIIYLDHNATTPLHPEVADAMIGVLRGDPEGPARFGNPSSLHSAGREARRRIEDARESLAGLIGAEPSEIIFTGGGTEANNLALLGFAAATKAAGRHLVASAFEHSSVVETLKHLESSGWTVTWVDPDGEGVVRAEAVAAAIRPDTALVSVMAANNELGTVQPAGGIGAMLRSKGIPFHCDAIQALGKLEAVRPRDWNADYLSLSAHKINGPKGVGALYVRKGAPLRGIQHGGPHERKLRGGTENVPGIVGFGKAAEVWARGGSAERARLRGLRDGLEAALRTRLPDLVVNGAGAERLPNTLHVTLPGCPADLMVMGLDMRGVAVSAGSACASGAVRYSHVVLALGKGMDAASTSLRLSVGLGNTEEEISAAADRIAGSAAAVRGAA